MLMISTALFHEMEVHVLSSHRRIEVCGLLAGKSNIVLCQYPITNFLDSPVRFSMEPQELLNALIDIERKEWEILAIYHSHPNGPHHPSPTDVDEATIPDIVHIIWAYAKSSWRWKSFTIDPPHYHRAQVFVYGNPVGNLD